MRPAPLSLVSSPNAETESVSQLTETDASVSDGTQPEGSVPSDRPIESMPPVIPDSPPGTVLWRIRGMIRTLRPHQWVKNLFVLAPVVFAKELTRPSLIFAALSAFAIFCLLAGAVYTLNDLVDAPADRVHPVKRRRPIASGRVPEGVARVMFGVLVVVSLGSALLLVNLPFFIVATAYFAQNVAYSFRLKKVAYLDVGFIALGFVLRVLAGGFATDTHVSGYMIACTALLALFLGFGKRRHELASQNAGKQRAALEAYSPRMLTAALAFTGAATVAIYFAYTLDPETVRFFNTRWLWVTTVHALFGVIRFLQLVVGRPKAESPTQEMLRDVPFVLNFVLWVIEIITFLYQVKLS